MTDEVRDKLRREILDAVARGIAPEARVQLDIGASGELLGRTKITVRDLMLALGIGP